MLYDPWEDVQDQYDYGIIHVLGDAGFKSLFPLVPETFWRLFNSTTG